MHCNIYEKPRSYRFIAPAKAESIWIGMRSFESCEAGDTRIPDTKSSLLFLFLMAYDSHKLIDCVNWVFVFFSGDFFLTPCTSHIPDRLLRLKQPFWFFGMFVIFRWSRNQPWFFTVSLRRKIRLQCLRYVCLRSSWHFYLHFNSVASATTSLLSQTGTLCRVWFVFIESQDDEKNMRRD